MNSQQAQISLYVAHIVYRNLPPDLTNPEDGSATMYKLRMRKGLLRIGTVAVKIIRIK